jgi:hypothetical protein
LLRIAQGNEGAPRSVSSVRRERAAGSANVNLQFIPNHHPASLKAFCDRYPSDIAVMVTWGGTSSNAGGFSSSSFHPPDLLDSSTTASSFLLSQGNHHISGLPVCPRLDMKTTSNQQEGCPLCLDISVSSIIHHSFRNSDGEEEEEEGDDTLPCVVPVKVRVSNQQFLGSKPVDFVLEVAQESQELSSDNLSWLGTTSYTVKALEATETVELELHALIPSPGVYELNQFGARMLTGNGSFFTFPIQCLVTVLDKDQV